MANSISLSPLRQISIKNFFVPIAGCKEKGIRYFSRLKSDLTHFFSEWIQPFIFNLREFALNKFSKKAELEEVIIHQPLMQRLMLKLPPYRPSSSLVPAQYMSLVDDYQQHPISINLDPALPRGLIRAIAAERANNQCQPKVENFLTLEKCLSINYAMHFLPFSAVIAHCSQISSVSENASSSWFDRQMNNVNKVDSAVGKLVLIETLALNLLESLFPQNPLYVRSVMFVAAYAPITISRLNQTSLLQLISNLANYRSPDQTSIDRLLLKIKSPPEGKNKRETELINNAYERLRQHQTNLQANLNDYYLVQDHYHNYDRVYELGQKLIKKQAQAEAINLHISFSAGLAALLVVREIPLPTNINLYREMNLIGPISYVNCAAFLLAFSLRYWFPKKVESGIEMIHTKAVQLMKSLAQRSNSVQQKMHQEQLLKLITESAVEDKEALKTWVKNQSSSSIKNTFYKLFEVRDFDIEANLAIALAFKYTRVVSSWLLQFLPLHDPIAVGLGSIVVGLAAHKIKPEKLYEGLSATDKKIKKIARDNIFLVAITALGFNISYPFFNTIFGDDSTLTTISSVLFAIQLAKIILAKKLEYFEQGAF
jgi:hypothetical protein